MLGTNISKIFRCCPNAILKRLLFVVWGKELVIRKLNLKSFLLVSIRWAKVKRKQNLRRFTLSWTILLMSLCNPHSPKVNDRKRKNVNEKYWPNRYLIRIFICFFFQTKCVQLRNLCQTSARFHNCKRTAAPLKKFSKQVLQTIYDRSIAGNNWKDSQIKLKEINQLHVWS